MALGSIQKVLICVPTTSTTGIIDLNGYCGTAFQNKITNKQVYILEPTSQNMFENSVLTDYTIPAEFYALALSTILSLWLLSKGIGYLLRVLK